MAGSGRRRRTLRLWSEGLLVVFTLVGLTVGLLLQRGEPLYGILLGLILIGAVADLVRTLKEPRDDLSAAPELVTDGSGASS